MLFLTTKYAKRNFLSLRVEREFILGGNNLLIFLTHISV